jgi:murein L,D-transpeptidase YcbB/YkuD
MGVLAMPSFSILFQFCQKANHRRLLSGLMFLTILSCSTPEQAKTQPNFLPQVQTIIERQVKVEIKKKGFACQGEIICGLQIIPMIYQQRDYIPLWLDADGLRPTARSLVHNIREAYQDGLMPTDYHLKAIERLLGAFAKGRLAFNDHSAELWAHVDLILTDAFLLLGSHLSAGRINPEDIHADWLIGTRSFDILSTLNAAETESQIRAAFDQLRPSHEGYKDLKSALKNMRKLASQGGWPQLNEKQPTIKPSEADEGVPTVRRLLSITSNFQGLTDKAQPDYYDAKLVHAVKKFQSRHGLDPDGVIGKKTRNAMNITVDQRIRQIELNLERWRWLPRDLGRRYVFVNTAAFDLQVMEYGRKVLEMKVVVGRPARQSPVFSSTMSYMVLNPYWNVPHKLAVEDILPKLADGVDYLINQRFKVLTDWSADAEELAPETIDWGLYNEHYFPLRLRQEPGKKNALGQIKFMFPNKFAVYLHDTPQKSLFTKFQRDYSSGCIRVENAQALASYLLSDSQVWTPELLSKTLEKGKRRVVHVPNPITIHLLYMTAWVDANGRLQFREDIYQRDSMLDRALISRNPYRLPSQTGEGGRFLMITPKKRQPLTEASSYQTPSPYPLNLRN